ncbi:MAG: DUF6440 family protein [Pseudoruminococcus massiliensis]
MRKKVIALVISLGLLITLVGCDDDILQEESCYYENSMFITVERARNWNIVYNNKTKVMYVVSNSAYNCGDFTLLVDADGKPMLYKGE